MLVICRYILCIILFFASIPNTICANDHAFIWDNLNGMHVIGTLGGRWSTATDINNMGQVIGVSENVDGQQHAFFWDSQNGMQDLGTLGGVMSKALGINDNGKVVGYSTDSNKKETAFIWDSENGMQALGAQDGIGSYAQAINNKDKVVGWVIYAVHDYSTFIWSHINNTQYIAAGKEFFRPYAINDAGIIVGQSDDIFSQAVVWDSENGLKNIHAGAGEDSCAFGINSLGQVVGSADYGLDPILFRAFIWDPENGTRILGNLPKNEGGRAIDINEKGQIIGLFNTAGTDLGYICDSKNGLTVIGEDVYPHAINNSGQVVGATFPNKSRSSSGSNSSCFISSSLVSF